MESKEDERPKNAGLGRFFIAALLLGAVAATAFKVFSTWPMSDKAFAKDAAERVLKSPNVGPHAHVTVAVGDGSLRMACGWVNLGAARGVAPFIVRGRSGDRWSEVSIETPFGNSLTSQAKNIYHLALSRELCSPSLLTPPPPGFALSKQSLDALGHMWGDSPSPWAVIQLPGREVFVGLSRRRGGGVIITPPFKAPIEVDRWIKAEGDVVAAREQARGEAALKADEACLERSRSLSEKHHCGAGLDETVQLQASSGRPPSTTISLSGD